MSGAFVLAAAICTGEGCRRDESGVAWVLPFAKAVEAAHQRQRLLLVKPIAFGTERSGGW